MGPRVLLIEVTLQRSVALERFLRFRFSVPYTHSDLSSPVAMALLHSYTAYLSTSFAKGGPLGRKSDFTSDNQFIWSFVRSKLFIIKRSKIRM
jgi:hypothetical protein